MWMISSVNWTPVMSPVLDSSVSYSGLHGGCKWIFSSHIILPPITCNGALFTWWDIFGTLGTLRSQVHRVMFRVVMANWINSLCFSQPPHVLKATTHSASFTHSSLMLCDCPCCCRCWWWVGCVADSSHLCVPGTSESSQWGRMALPLTTLPR